MILKTDCRKCIFNNKGSCQLGKTVDIQMEEGFLVSQTTKGLCGHKKSSEWAEKLALDDSVQKFHYSDGEYKTLSALIHVPTFGCRKARIGQIAKILQSLNENCFYLKEVIISTYQKNKDDINDIVDIVKEHCKVPYTFDFFLIRPQNIPMQMEKSSRLVKTNWFLTLGLGHKLKPKSIQAFEKIICDRTNNPIAFYFKEKNCHNIIAPIYAFRQMEGNSEMPWFEKVKTFDNWKEICWKI